MIIGNPIMLGGSSGGGLDPSKPLIHVNAPLGSTVYITSSGGVIVPIPSSSVFPNSDGSTADYYYSCPSTGTYTVTATLNGKTASNTVSVSAAEQYDVALNYFYKVFDRTVDSFADIANGFVPYSAFSFFDYSSEFIRIAASGNYNYRDSWSAPLPNDISAYSTLDVYCYDETGDSRDKVGITSTAVADTDDTWIASIGTSNTTPQLLQIPLTSAMAGKYFTIRLNGGKTMYIKYVHLSP